MGKRCTLFTEVMFMKIAISPSNKYFENTKKMKRTMNANSKLKRGQSTDWGAMNFKNSRWLSEQFLPYSQKKEVNDRLLWESITTK